MADIQKLKLNVNGENETYDISVPWSKVTNQHIPLSARSTTVSSIGWYKIAIDNKNTTQANAIIDVKRTYNNVNNETYTFLINCSYSGNTNITQLGGKANSQIITKIAVYNPPHPYDRIIYIYYNSTTDNTINITCSGDFTATYPVAETIKTSYITELDINSFGFKTNGTIVGNLSGTATYSSRLGTSSAYYTKASLDTALNGKSNTGHTHDYLPLSGGIIKGGMDLTSYPNSSDGYKMGLSSASSSGIHFEKIGSNDYGQAITWSYGADDKSHAGIYVKSSGGYGTKMYLCTTNLFADGSKAALEIDQSGNITALRNKFIGNLTGNASSATKLTTDAGSVTNPIYFSGGKPVACTYSLNKTVPADAKFTDTNTWRPVTNTYTGSDQSTCVSQYGTNALYNALVNGYASSAGYISNSTYYYSGNVIKNTTSADDLFGLTATDNRMFPAFMENHPLWNGYADVAHFTGYCKWGATQLATEYNEINPRIAIRKYNQTRNNWGDWTELLTPKYLEDTIKIGKKVDDRKAVWLKLTTPGHTGADAWYVGVDDTSDNSYLTFGYGSYGTSNSQLYADHTGKMYAAGYFKKDGTSVSYNGHTHDNYAAVSHGTHITSGAQTLSGTKTFSSKIVASAGITIGSTDDIGWYLNSNRITAGTSVARDVNVGSLLVSSAWADASNVPTNGIYCKGNIKAAAFYQNSDERLKTFYNPIKPDLEKLKTLRKNYFKFNDRDELEIGVSAQEIQQLYPEIVSENGDGYLSVAYDKLSVIALSAIDELDDKILQLANKISTLENIVNKLMGEKGIN